MSAIRTKVDRQALIDRLKETLKTNEKNIAENKKRMDAANKLRADHATKVLKSVKQKDITDLRHETENTYRNGSLVIVFARGAKLPAFELPEELNQISVLQHWEVNEIDQAIKVLEMSTDQSISMSALKDIARFL